MVDNDIEILLIKKLKYKDILIKPTNLYIAIAKTLWQIKLQKKSKPEVSWYGYWLWYGDLTITYVLRLSYEHSYFSVNMLLQEKKKLEELFIL